MRLFTKAGRITSDRYILSVQFCDRGADGRTLRLIDVEFIWFWFSLYWR